MNKQSENWKNLPLHLKIWFTINFMQVQPKRNKTNGIFCHFLGFMFCLLGLVDPQALVSGLIILLCGYLFTLLKWQGDKYEIWSEPTSREGT